MERSGKSLEKLHLSRVFSLFQHVADVVLGVV